MAEKLSQQEIIDNVTLQIELLKETDEVLNPSEEEKQQTIALLFEQYNLYYQEGSITEETREHLINLWLDHYLSVKTPDSACDK